MNESPAVEYRIQPELRRSCWYGFVGLVLAAGIILWRLGSQDVEAVAAALAIPTFVGLLLTLPLRRRVRIDEIGVSQRRLWGWDVWPWADFASGRLRKRHRFIFVDPQRPWGRRKLSLDLLESGEAREAVERINRYYKPPQPPDISSGVAIQWMFQHRLELDQEGLHYTSHKGVSTDYAWSDLQAVEITRMDPLRQDFQQCLLVLPDREIQLLANDDNNAQSWRDSTYEEVNEILQQYTPKGRLHVFIFGEFAPRRETVERNIQQAEKKCRETVFVIYMFGGSLVSIFALCAWGGEWLKAIAFTLFFGVSMLVFGASMRRNQERQLAAWRENLKALDNVGKPKEQSQVTSYK